MSPRNQLSQAHSAWVAARKTRRESGARVVGNSSEQVSFTTMHNKELRGTCLAHEEVYPLIVLRFQRSLRRLIT
jgi:hypothetical protein